MNLTDIDWVGLLASMLSASSIWFSACREQDVNPVLTV
jgi:hypothetical protein